MPRSRTLLLAAFVVVSTAVGCTDDGPEVEIEATDTARAPDEDVAPGSHGGDVGSIEGVVRNVGQPIVAQSFKVTANSDVCGDDVRSNLAEISADGGVGGAVVYVPIESSTRSQTRTMDQVGCQYTPRVIATSPGSVVRFTNSDPTAHNVRVQDIDGGSIKLNVAQASSGAVNEWTVPEAGTYIVGCDYHPWMNAYIVAVESHLVAVTDSEGRYRIDGVPAGQRALRLWHNGITATEKRDVEGRMIGYRFADPIVLPEFPLTIDAGKVLTYDVPLDLMKLSKQGGQ